MSSDYHDATSDSAGCDPKGQPKPSEADMTLPSSEHCEALPGPETVDPRTVSPETPQRKRSPRSTKSRSRASSTSPGSPRLVSASTAGGRSTKTARHQHGSSAISPRSSMQMSQKKREDLLALHRESCRLFEEAGLAGPPAATGGHESRRPERCYTAPAHAPRIGGVSSTAARPRAVSSVTASPVLRSYRSPSFGPSSRQDDGDLSDQELLGKHSMASQSSIVHSEPDPTTTTASEEKPYLFVPATVIDWTSPSTRRREYEKIDRSNRGLRGLWRRIAPPCFRPSYSRTPFFEEGKSNHEGSVRRFRMDLPDKEATSTSSTKPTSGRWGCF
ncbi:hypothetical protein VTN31DRAFT_147 [Thermomyces dupontii]|uniref:uncharacterized protein n=1 Tax=Talaromyces thermophilus TaxID=28565 RepID=UPI003743FBAD